MSLYLDLLKRSLIGLTTLPWERKLNWPHTGTDEARLEGRDWPMLAHTMLGMKRLQNIEDLAINIIRDNIPGDLCECGVWRGGATILMAGILEWHGDTQRKVWACDSFAGVPAPSPEYPQDRNMTFHQHKDYLSASIDEVREAFDRYGLGHRFSPVVGLFRDSLPGPIEQLALLRCDGDLYESTWQILDALYPKVVPGGYVIVDDYGNIPPCHEAVDRYRAENGIDAPMHTVDWSAVWWMKEV